jgi:hypothetical protein
MHCVILQILKEPDLSILTVFKTSHITFYSCDWFGLQKNLKAEENYLFVHSVNKRFLNGSAEN